MAYDSRASSKVKEFPNGWSREKISGAQYLPLPLLPLTKLAEAQWVMSRAHRAAGGPGRGQKLGQVSQGTQAAVSTLVHPETGTFHNAVHTIHSRYLL